MRFFLILLVLIIGNVGYSQQLKQIQKGTANNQIPVTNGTQYTQVYRDALPYILDTLGIRDSIAVLSVSTPDSIYLSGDSIMLRDGSGFVILKDTSSTNELPAIYYYFASLPSTTGTKIGDYAWDGGTNWYVSDGSNWYLLSSGDFSIVKNNFTSNDSTYMWRYVHENNVSGDIGIVAKEKTGLLLEGNNNQKVMLSIDTSFIATVNDLNKIKDSTIVQNSYGTIITETPANTFNIAVDSSLFATTYDITQISTEPDSIQRSGNIISLRDGSGSVDISDLVNAADSTIVQNSYGTIITESPTNTYNVKVDSSLFATTYDIAQKQNIITGTSGQTLRFDGTNSLIANSLLYNVGNQIGIGTITPTASYILDVAGNTKIRDGFLTVDGTVFINASNTLNMYNSANTGIFHSYQDGATSIDNIVYRGQYKTFTIGYNAGAGQSYANVSNKKLHVNGAVSIGDGVSATSVAANSLLVQGSATVQDRTGTAATLSAFDTNGKLVGATLGTGLSWSGNTLNGNVGNVTGSGTATRLAFWSGTSTLSSNANLYWDNSNNRLGIGTSSPSKQLTTTQDILVNGNDIGLGGGNQPNNARFGNAALNNNTTGVGNLAIGAYALLNNTTGYYNIALGNQAMFYNVSGHTNTAIGQNVLIYNTGSKNTGIGTQSLYNNIGGLENTGIGPFSLYSNVTGNSNIAIGFGAGYSETGSGKLYIEPSTSSTPLIGGDFVTDRVGINKNIASINSTLHVGGDITIDTRTGTPAKMAAFTSTGVLCETTLPTTPETWFDFGTKIQSWNSTGGFGSGKDVGIGIDPSQDFDLNGNARLRGAIYNSSNSAGTTGQVLTSQGTGSWIWSTVDQSTTNELQTISTSGTAGNITLSNGGGTLNLNINDADASTTNEGFLGVSAGASNDAKLQGYNDSGINTGTGVTISGNYQTYITENVSTNGGSIILNAAAPYTYMVNSSATNSLTTSFTKIPLIGYSTLNGDALYLTYDDANDEIDITVAGTYKLEYNCNCKSNSSAHLVTFNLLDENLTSLSATSKHYFNNTNEYSHNYGTSIISITSAKSFSLYAKTDTGTPNVNDCIIRVYAQRLK